MSLWAVTCHAFWGYLGTYNLAKGYCTLLRVICFPQQDIMFCHKTNCPGTAEETWQWAQGTDPTSSLQPPASRLPRSQSNLELAAFSGPSLLHRGCSPEPTCPTGATASILVTNTTGYPQRSCCNAPDRSEAFWWSTRKQPNVGQVLSELFQLSELMPVLIWLRSGARWVVSPSQDQQGETERQSWFSLSVC